MTDDMPKEKAIDLLDNLIGMVEDNQNSDYDTALKMAIKALKQESKRITGNERICELVKIVATSDLGKPLVNTKVTYLFDKQTMTIYAPWASCEMIYALGLTIVDLPEKEVADGRDKVD